MKSACAALALICAACHGAGNAPDRAEPARTATITFTRDVAPIVFEHCAGCHRPGELAPFALLSYDDVRRRGLQIADVTARRYMPPWKPAPGRGVFEGARGLSDHEIDLLARWVDAGMPEGDPADLPPAPAGPHGWQLGEPDLVVTLPEAYTLPADGTDVYRNFAIPIPVPARRYVRAVEFRPGNASVVHHVRMLIDRSGAARRLDAADPDPGYDGMLVDEAEFPDGHFLGWTPGRTPSRPPAGLAWRLDRGTDLVLQMHLLPSGRPESVAARIGFFFADTPPARTPAMIRLGSKALDIPAGARDYIVEDSFVLPVDVDVLTVYPHAHYLARDMQATAELPDGQREWLLHIPDWDFNWQDDYRYVTPISLPRGTRVHMRYTYDNSAENVRNPHRPPERVRYGPQSSDEMADLWLQVLPGSDADLATLNEAFRARELAQSIKGYELRLAHDPTNAVLHDDLALLYLLTGRLADGRRHLEEAVRLDPAYAPAHYDLGALYVALEQPTEAARELSRAIALDASHSEAFNLMGSLVHSAGRIEEAAAHYRRALDVRPNFAEAHNNLGGALLAQGQVSEAVEHFRQAAAINPDYAEAHHNLGNALAGRGELPAAVRAYREAARLTPDWPPPLAELALILAASPDPSVRNPREAVEIGERVAALTARENPMVLMILATAYAANGRTADAIATAEAALRIAEAAGDTALAGELRQQLEGYRRRP